MLNAYLFKLLSYNLNYAKIIYNNEKISMSIFKYRISAWIFFHYSLFNILSVPFFAVKVIKYSEIYLRKIFFRVLPEYT